uniref:Uncharacterized protein n=1 Tax=Cannabis sativa TaxID=3483 RepID=A0A803Q540_CANSA
MWIFGWKGPSGFSARSTAEEVTQGIDGTGLTAIVTGASSGLGEETTRVFALRGVHVIMAVRNLDAGRKVKDEITKEIPSAKIDIMELDLSSLESVRKFASDYKSSGLPLNLLINNAGVMATPFMLSKDNIELQFATNHLAVANAVGKFVLKNVQQGASTQCYVALHPQVKGVSGEYFVDNNKSNPTTLAKDAELAKKLWDFSLSLTNPK